MASDPTCIFCKIVAGTTSCFKIFEDAETLAFMDINPVHDGHCLVIPKAHYRTVFDLPAEIFAAVGRTAIVVAKAVNAAVRPDGVNLLQANGPGAAQTVPHFHLHVVPRRINDGLPMNWTSKPGERATIADTAQRIRSWL